MTVTVLLLDILDVTPCSSVNRNTVNFGHFLISNILVLEKNLTAFSLHNKNLNKKR